MSAPRTAAWIGLAGALVAGCAEILGAGSTDTRLLGEAFCRCDDAYREAWPGETCEGRFARTLAEADPAERREFIDLFEEAGCHRCGEEEGRRTCAQSQPVCVPQGGACEGEVCCAEKGRITYCGDNGRCASDSPDCKGPGAPCDPALTECCGQAGAKAACVPFGDGGAFQCSYATCDIDAPTSCPGCCAIVTEDPAAAPIGLCASEGGQVDTEVCQLVCGAAGDGCKANEECLPTFVQDDGEELGTARLCLPSCVGVRTPCGDPQAQGCCAAWVGDTSGEINVCISYSPPVGSCADLCAPSNAPLGCSCTDEVEIPDNYGEKFSVFFCQ